MMMTIKSAFLFLLLLLAAGTVYAQDNDFGLWYEVNAEKSVNKKFDISGTIMVRTFDNASILDQAYFEIGASYDLNKYIGFAGSYRIGNYLDDDDYYHIRHKWFADIKGSLPLKHFVLSARIRLQLLARSYVEDKSDDREEYDGRLKLKGEYKIPDFPVNPYLTFETFTPLFRNDGNLIEKSRSTIGFEYKISKKHIINTEYIYQRDEYPHLSILHIISLGYTFKF
jgi:hypothetical protein